MAYEFNFDKDKCWYKKICEKYNTKECTKRCIRYSEMDYLMYLSNIPKPRQQPFSLQPQKEDVEAFYFLKDIQDHINEFVANGENLYIHSSNTGNGKTCWSIKLMQQYFNNVWYGNRFRCRGLFIFVPAFLNDVKKNINNPKLAIIISRLNYVISNICVMDIPFDLYIRNIGYDQNTVNYILSIIGVKNDFFNFMYIIQNNVNVFDRNSMVRPFVVSSISIDLYNIAGGGIEIEGLIDEQ